MNSNRKNIIFLTMVSINNIEERGLYQDFIREMSNYHNIYVVTPNERRFNQNTELLDLDHIKILSVKTGNLTQTKSNIEKGISTLSLEYRYLKAMKKYFKNIKFDWVIYSTPPIKFNKIISYYKRNYNIKTYLMLKDIFPQNAVDLEMISENGIIHRFFRKEEKKCINYQIK